MTLSTGDTCCQICDLNVQSFRQMYWHLRDFISILHWTYHEWWLIADPPILLIDSFIGLLDIFAFWRLKIIIFISLLTTSRRYRTLFTPAIFLIVSSETKPSI